MTAGGTAAMVEDMRERAADAADVVRRQPPDVGAWGTSPSSRAASRRSCSASRNPVAHWAPLFAAGTQPTTDAAAYPPFDEVFQTYRDLRARNLKLLDEVGEAGLDRVPKDVPAGFRGRDDRRSGRRSC